MNTIQAIILGIVQGLTEFLPISSTGHLTLAGKIMGLLGNGKPDQSWTAFMAVIQLGTMLAVLIYFWRELWNIGKEFLQDNLFHRREFQFQSQDSKMGWFIIVGTVPVVAIGLGFKDIIEGALTKNLFVIAGSLIVLGILLAIAERIGSRKRDISSVTFLDAVLIGLAQACALIPGSSRSGTTITAGLFVGLKRDSAAKFSFLLSVPAVLGSGLLEFYKGFLKAHQAATIGYGNIFLATLLAFITGYITIGALLSFLRTRTTVGFVVYRILLGAIILGLLSFHMISA